MTVSPPFEGALDLAASSDGKIITGADPTTLVSVTDAGQGRRQMFDRRLGPAEFDAFLFNAKFDDGLAAEIQVNPEFGSSEARNQANYYAPVIGRLPTALRSQVKTVWIHQGGFPYGGGNDNLLIHTGYGCGDILEEALMHEACHTSLDGQISFAPDWIAAQRADGGYISNYARDFPEREDVAESFLCYLALRYRSGRISEANADKILRAIPNRIAYFDAHPLAMHPIAPMPPLLKLVKASASSELAVPYNGRPQTADRLIEGPNDGRWCSVPRGPPSIGVPRPANSAWFSLQLEHRSVINSFYIRWKTAYGHVGARPMKYKVLSSLDGKSWTETGVDQRLVRGLPPNLAVDVLPGWPDPTQFIKVEMSESSYGTDGYFSCHYVLVTGRAL